MAMIPRPPYWPWLFAVGALGALALVLALGLADDWEEDEEDPGERWSGGACRQGRAHRMKYTTVALVRAARDALGAAGAAYDSASSRALYEPGRSAEAARRVGTGRLTGHSG